jgi:hypothetical protein
LARVKRLGTTLFLTLCSEKVARHSGELKHKELTQYLPATTARFREQYDDLLEGQPDCVDRIILNACFPLGQRAGGFRTWWRMLNGGYETLDVTHVTRMARRFNRRVRALPNPSLAPLSIGITGPCVRICRAYSES